MIPAYPVNLDLAGRPVLVVGGGTVAARKIDELVRCGATVTVVSPHSCEDVHRAAAAGTISLDERPYRAGEAAGYRLVITATDRREVNQAVHDDAEAAGVWVNAADDPQRCTFTLPARHRVGPVTVAVSTGGASPALASWLCRRLANEVGPEFADLAEILAGRRRAIHDAGGSTEDLAWDAVIEAELAALRDAGGRR